MWVMGLAMMAVMIFGMHDMHMGDGAGQKGNSRQEVPQAVQMDHGHGRSGAGQREMMHEGGHDMREPDGKAAESEDKDRGTPAPLPESAPPVGDKDGC